MSEGILIKAQIKEIDDRPQEVKDAIEKQREMESKLREAKKNNLVPKKRSQPKPRPEDFGKPIRTLPGTNDIGKPKQDFYFGE